MSQPRPIDFLRAEILRLQDERAQALRRHTRDDQDVRDAIRHAYDRRIYALGDELADALHPSFIAPAPIQE